MKIMARHCASLVSIRHLYTYLLVVTGLMKR